MKSSDSDAYDVVGVGFGPSNLSLAVALEELPPTDGPDRMNAVFFERQPSVRWHTGMLLPGAKMQVSFLKDLVTFRNPVSRYSFVSYLHAAGRLAGFVNTKDFFPTRVEFHRYLEWVAASLATEVAYDAEVAGVEPVRGADGAVDLLRVRVRRDGGAAQTILTRNIVVSTGLVPRVPAGAARGPNIWHSSEFLGRYREREQGTLKRVAVVGAGQSAAEIVRYLYDMEPAAEIYAVVPSYGYSIADNTPFANQIFDPAAVDDFYNAPARSKDVIWTHHKNTNYSVVDDEVIDSLFRRHCQDALEDKTRIHFVNVARLQSVTQAGDTLQIGVESMLTAQLTRLDVDLLVCATGYQPMDPGVLLGELDGYCQRDEENRYRVERDYRIVTSPELRCGIYLQGGTEHTHGLSSSLLSNIAVRSGEIVDSIVRRRRPADPGPAAAAAPAGPAAAR